MAMTVMHNSAAQMALGELNKNVNKAGDLLAKVSSGLRIVGAKDDSASFAISEKMREQIRSLLQDNQNVQNGASLIKNAEGGIDEIVKELRSLKELAINAANDTNTSQDRLSIQKELDQRMAEINDIATEMNYNGKPLLDGTYTRKVEHIRDVIKPSSGGAVYTPENLTDAFSAHTGTYEDGKTKSRDGYDVNSSFNRSSSSYIEVNVDFSTLTITQGVTVANALNGKGFSIFCSNCPQYVNMIFDGSSDKSSYNGNIPGSKPGTREYVIGIKSVTNLADLPKAIFEGIKSTATSPNPQGYAPGSSYYTTTIRLDNKPGKVKGSS